MMHTHGEETLGQRLRKARLAKDLGLAETAARLRLPIAMVEAIEADDHERLGAWVYARGYLVSYARLVGVPQAAVDALAQRFATAPPPLQATARTSRSHILVERYARRAVYLVLTAAIVLPVVFFARLDRLDVRQVALQPLSPSPDVDAVQQAPAEPVPAAREQQVVASMTPFYRQQGEEVAATGAAPGATSVPSDAAAAAGMLRLELRSPSWVEVVARDGSRLEYGLLEGGVARSYPVSDVLRVSVGDADAIRIAIDGEAVDLAPFRRAKVARFELSSSGQPTPADG